MRAGFRGPLNQRFEFGTQERKAHAPHGLGQKPAPEGFELIRSTVLPPAGGRTVPSTHPSAKNKNRGNLRYKGRGEGFRSFGPVQSDDRNIWDKPDGFKKKIRA